MNYRDSNFAGELKHAAETEEALEAEKAKNAELESLLQKAEARLAASRKPSLFVRLKLWYQEKRKPWTYPSSPASYTSPRRSYNDPYPFWNRSRSDTMIGVAAVLFIVVGIPGIIYLMRTNTVYDGYVTDKDMIPAHYAESDEMVCTNSSDGKSSDCHTEHHTTYMPNTYHVALTYDQHTDIHRVDKSIYDQSTVGEWRCMRGGIIFEDTEACLQGHPQIGYGSK